MQNLNKVEEKGNRAFSIVSAVLFLMCALHCLLSAFSAFQSMILGGYSFSGFSGGGVASALMRSVAESIFMMCIFILLSVACFIGKKSLFAVIAIGVAVLSSLCSPFISSLLFGLSTGFSLTYLINLTALSFMFVIALLNKISQKCAWTKFVGYVPGVLMLFAYLLQELQVKEAMGIHYAETRWSYILYAFFIMIPAWIFFGTWITSQTKNYYNNNAY